MPSRRWSPPSGGVSPKGNRPSSLPSYAPHSSSLPGFPLSGSSAGIPRQIKRPRKILYLVFIFFLLYWFGIRHGLGIERQAPAPLGFYSPTARRGRRSSLVFDSRGMATLSPEAREGRGEHPIYELMERGEERWIKLLKGQSRTLEAAVAEYRKRYGMSPPAGFAEWFAFCQEHSVAIVDEYDQLMRDLLPHHALRPETFIARSRALENQDFTYTLDVSPAGVKINGPRSENARPKQLARQIEGFKHALPKGFALVVTGSDHDTGSVVLGVDQRTRAMELVRQGRYFDEAELKQLEDPHRTPAFGWFKACPLDSPANIRPGAENATQDILPKSFIHELWPTMDFCEYPELKRLHGAMSLDYANRSPSLLKPVLVLSKFPHDASFQTTPMEAYFNITSADIPYLGSWSEKTDPRIFWRGSTTGGFNVQRDWKESHRMRLHLMVNGPKGGDAWWEGQAREVMMPDGTGGFKVARRWDRVLGHGYADVKLSGGPKQCPKNTNVCDEISKTIEFGDKVWPEQAAAYRYALDVDGNGWSSRFHRLLSSGSPVIKFTMFPEWNMEWLTPWYHYIPLKADYSDMYDIMSFFVGPIDEAGNIDETKGHDYLGEKIGAAGQEFAIKHWRWVDMQAYTFRLLLELQRLHSLDREAMSYKDPIKET